MEIAMKKDLFFTAMAMAVACTLAAPAEAERAKRRDGAYVTPSGIHYTVRNGRYHGLGCGKKYGRDTPAALACVRRVVGGGPR
jgi:hypothetical protein